MVVAHAPHPRSALRARARCSVESEESEEEESSDDESLVDSEEDDEGSEFELGSDEEEGAWLFGALRSSRPVVHACVRACVVINARALRRHGLGRAGGAGQAGRPRTPLF